MPSIWRTLIQTETDLSLFFVVELGVLFFFHAEIFDSVDSAF